MGAENMMTEAEAKTKWCPLDRGSYSERHIGGTMPHCIGSDCMAWRWDTDGWAWVSPGGGPHVFTMPSDGTARGFCGAFGKAEPT